MDHFVFIATLVCYQILLLGVGAWASKHNRDGTDFYLAGRKLGPWVSSLSCAASSSSAWSLLGVSGAAYATGLGAIWLLPACFLGFALNWFVVAPRLRRASLSDGSVTLTEFLASDLPTPWRRPFTVSASIVILASLGTYVASQFQGAGKTFSETLNMDPLWGVVIGACVVFAYTWSGGFWAVSVTDTLQGAMMALASILLPASAWWAVRGHGGVWDGLIAIDPVLVDPLRGLGGMAAVGLVVGLLGIGLGYPGQPHVVNRFMAIRDGRALRQARVISLAWAAIMYSGMLMTGWCARILLPQERADAEGVFFALVNDLFPPIAAGILVAAVLSAIMSTADSQLLVCASTVSHDLASADAAPGRSLRNGRVAVVGVGSVALVAAVIVDKTIFDTVLFAWSALGAAFGPLLLVRLFRKQVQPAWALASLWGGFLVSVLWFLSPTYKAMIYELVPAFCFAFCIAWMGSRATRRFDAP